MRGFGIDWEHLLINSFIILWVGVIRNVCFCLIFIKDLNLWVFECIFGLGLIECRGLSALFVLFYQHR
jgi:hypothetical protein